MVAATRCYYDGCVYDVHSVTFDLVDQVYRMDISEFRILKYWRRDSGMFAVGQKSAQIFIGDTAHIKKMKEENRTTQQICTELYSSSASYIEYAITERNKELVYVVTNSNIAIPYDRLNDANDAMNTLYVPMSKREFVRVFDAY